MSCFPCQLSEKVDNLLDQAGVVPSDPDRLRAYLVELVRASYQAGRTSVHREASRRETYTDPTDLARQRLRDR